MITRNAPRTGRVFLGALILSLLIHVFGGALWGGLTHAVASVMRRLPEQHPPEEQVATSDAIRLEKRTIPRPAQRSRPVPATRPLEHPHPAPKPVVPRVALRPKDPVETPAPKRATPAPRARPEVAHRAPHATLHAPKPQTANVPAPHAPAAAPQKAALTASQLAALNAQFAKTIAATHVDLATIQKQTEERPVATRHYPMQFTGMEANLRRGEGYISPTTVGRRIGGTVWYYTHYTYMWPDGHIEDDDIPWPFRFPVNHDLFALHVRLIPLQLPPPGFHVDRPLKPFLAHFLQTAGAG